MGEPYRARPTRRGLLGAAATLGLGAAGCAAPWGRGPAPPAGVTPGAGESPQTAGRPRKRLHLVVSQEGLPELDAAVGQALAGAAGATETPVEVQDAGAFAFPGPGRDPGADLAGALAQGLLAAVQAGVPPDALLLLGREVQVARFQTQGLVLDVPGLMRRVRARLGETARVHETLHVVAGNWFAVPWYQRLVGHWVRQPVIQSFRAGSDGPDGLAGASAGGGPAGYADLRRALADLSETETARWGIGGADTPDVDAWCWGAIHAWGGGLADRKGERVNLDTPETVGALEWLAGTLTAATAGGRVHPGAGTWSDGDKNAAFGRGETAYTYSERALPGAAPGPDPNEAIYVRTLAGPVARPRAVGGGAAWLLPRGTVPEATERFLEALLEVAVQRHLWQAGGRFALPAYQGGWDDPAIAGAPWAETAGRFRAELDLDGDAFVSATGNGGPETAASQAIGTLRFGAGMLRAVLAGRPAGEVVAETQRRAADLYRSFGLPG